MDTQGRYPLVRRWHFAPLFVMAVVTFMVMVLVLQANPAKAEDRETVGAGESTGASTGTIRGPLYWKVAKGDSQQSAWGKFTGAKTVKKNGAWTYQYDYSAVGLTGTTWRSTYKNLSHLPQYNNAFVKNCERSAYVWWVAGSSGTRGRQTMWAHNTHAITLPAVVGTKSVNRYFTSPLVVDPRSQRPPAALAQVILKSLASKPRNLTVVCSRTWETKIVDNPDPQDDPKTCTVNCGPSTVPPPPVVVIPPKPPVRPTPPPVVREPLKVCVNTPSTFDRGALPHSYTTVVERHDLENSGGFDPIGEDNLHDQPMAVKRTHYGEILDGLSTTYKNTPASEVNALMDAALAKDRAEGHAKVNLDEKNKKGMGEGGILDITETTNTMRSSLYSNVYSCRTRVIVPESFKWSRDAQGKRVKVVVPAHYGPWSAPVVVSTLNTHGTYSPKLNEVTAFWQMLSVHCNEQGFNNLVKKSGATVENEGNPETRVAAVAYSKMHTSKVYDFGAIGDASYRLGFYDKECPFDCRKTPTAVTHGPLKAPQNPGAYAGPKVTSGANTGATGTAEAAGDRFTFFRDNLLHNVAIDLWRPAATAAVRATGKEAVLSTTIVRDPNGTPGLKPNENGNGSGGIFSMTGETGEVIFGPDSAGAPTEQRNTFGNTALFEGYLGTNSAQFAGLVDLVRLKATWASNKNAPLAFNVKYEFAPLVGTNIAVKDIGFGVSSVRTYGEREVIATPVEGKCYVEFGPEGTSKDASGDPFTRDLFQVNTGTDSVNGLDDDLLVSQQGTQKKTLTEGTYPKDAGYSTKELLVNFIRATTE